MTLPNKYEMPKEENIFIAKRVLVDSVYQQANLEGIGVTFADTQDILNNVNVPSLTPTEISKVCCLRDGWEFLLENIDTPTDLVFIETLHEIVARFDVPYQYLGKLWTEEVIISGTKWRPKRPDADRIFHKLASPSDKSHMTDHALELGLWLIRCQPFKDGNKRIGSFVINKILIQNGCGVFNVPVKLDGRFKQYLVDFYESNNTDFLKQWIYENCLDGTHEIAPEGK